MVFLLGFALILAALLIFFGKSVLFSVTMLHGPVFVPSKIKDIETMIKLAKLKKTDRIIDLGSGDGEILIELAKRGYTCTGVEINPLLVRQSRKRIQELGLKKLITIERGSFWNIDYSKYDVTFLYGTTYIMEKLEKKLRSELPKNARVISNYFQFPNWKASKTTKKIRLYKQTTSSHP